MRRIANLSTRFYSANSGPIPVTVARGDGIGPEIMDAALRVLEQADVKLAPEFVTIGEDLYTNVGSAASSELLRLQNESLFYSFLFFFLLALCSCSYLGRHVRN